MTARRRCVAYGIGLLTLVTLAVMTLVPAAVNAAADTTPFHAYDVESGKLKYRGEYRVEQEGALLRETHVYRTLEGEEVVRVSTAFDLSTMEPLAYNSRDVRHGRTVDATVRDGSLHYTVQDDAGTETRVMEEVPPDLFFWPNLVHVIASNWKALASGEGMRTNLFVFPLNKALTMRIDKAGATRVNGRDRVELTLNPDTWYYRLLSEPIRITFGDGVSPEILEYTGKSAVRDEEGDHERLRIVFQRAHYASTGQDSRG